MKEISIVQQAKIELMEKVIKAIPKRVNYTDYDTFRKTFIRKLDNLLIIKQKK